MSTDPGRESRRKVTTKSLLEMKQAGDRISALTAYDFLMAGLIDRAGVDVILVGDSVAMVVQGGDTTVTVTMEHMLYHAKLVSLGVERALVVGDLPFMSFQVNADEALRNAGRMVKESHVEAVKLEGGEVICPTVRRLVEVGIPVMGHLGLTPQSIHKFGSYQVRATTDVEADEIRRDAVALQENAGIDILTDGEWRRASYIGVIAQLAHGFELGTNPADGRPWTIVVDKLAPRNPGFIAAEVRYLK
ncbi:MAG: 3-methyl-2-oxobutanoate hydroxymethyltransferase, partial [Myxococcota bacterium]|nr:3-methyl-2-oxobutanoate hydroxymethyltransferase [Myxococcota bacterium]